jgi:hypothetical protein
MTFALKPRPFTPEEQAAARAKSLLRIRQMQSQTSDYKKDWLDADWWQSLAAAKGVRLPPWYVPATESKLKSWARRLGKTPFSEHYGCNPARLISLNPKTPLRAFVGQMLEP